MPMKVPGRDSQTEFSADSGTDRPPQGTFPNAGPRHGGLAGCARRDAPVRDRRRQGQRPVDASHAIATRAAARSVKKAPPNHSIERGWYILR
jgi:hypothetical protein